ncbi:MAG: EAL domain-containing protein [Lachnospiraceae bacterium]|nr:EAL domain-containing protein [Lachnospiraceae bacterium]
MLKYYPQYCQAAVAATIVLLIMYLMKENYATRQNRLFVCMLIDNLFASALNILTFYTISFPERYPMWLNYLSNQVYLLLFNLLGVIFMLYIDVMIKIPRFKKGIQLLAAGILAVDVFLLFSSPFTHLSIYYDENLVYRHGPLMILLYVTAFVAVFAANIVFVAARKRFNAYQVFSITGFVLCIFVSVIFQAFHPPYVISNFTCALMLFFLYSAFENPAYYTYNDTRCYNRQAFLETVHRIRKKEEPYTIIGIKMAGFDVVVNAYGQENVAIISGKIAERLNNVFGNKAYALSINCFAILTTEEECAQLIKKVKESFETPFSVDAEDESRDIPIDVVVKKIPIVRFDIDGMEMEEIVHEIMSAGAEDTHEIENVEKTVASVHRRRELIRIINEAIRQERFEVYYQPILDTKTMKFHSAEALVRLQDEKFGFISPEEFIPLAESRGQIDAIGKMVFEKVCEFMRNSNCCEYGVDYIEINLSPVQCRQVNLVETLLGTMEEYDIEPSRINLEITETAEMESSEMLKMTGIMNRLHNYGVTFAIDDFGSGFAAIDYLVKLPMDLVKIDKSILWQAMEDKVALMVLQHTIRMIKEVNKKIVVEGVETKEMMDFLVSEGCDYLQGYYFSKPVPQEKYLEFLKENV